MNKPKNIVPYHGKCGMKMETYPGQYVRCILCDTRPVHISDLSVERRKPEGCLVTQEQSGMGGQGVANE